MKVKDLGFFSKYVNVTAGLIFYRQVIGNSSEVYRQWAGWVTATSVEADRNPANPVTSRNHRNQKK